MMVEEEIESLLREIDAPAPKLKHTPARDVISPTSVSLFSRSPSVAPDASILNLLCTLPSTTPPEASPFLTSRQAQKGGRPNVRRDTLADSMDSLLDGLLENETASVSLTTMRTPQPDKTKIKCTSAMLSNRLKADSCTLRCLSCDLPVLSMDPECQWSDKADYIFFRNYYPDKARLKGMLVSARGKSILAYCCQCSWINVQEEVLLGATSFTGEGVNKISRSWVCRGH